ncbi:MAG: SDR family oxidoreductase [Candidatus Velamenicoccus archaeovorus]
MSVDPTVAGTMDGVPGLDGRVVLVTGGGGGLGRAICRVLGRAGAAVVAADVRADGAAETARRVLAEGGRAEPVDLDVTDRSAAEEAVERIVRAHGRLDVLVNNAGIDVTLPFDELPMQAFDRILDVNLRGPVLLSRAVFPRMRAEGGGQIVNVVSTAAKRAWTNASAYHASKWGLLGFSHALHAEGRALGIKVTAVVAGGMRTRFLFDRFPDLDPGVLQEPENVAETIRFVLSCPAGTVIPEVMVLPMGETSWP